MSLINTGSARSARSYEPLHEEPKARELQLDERIADNVGDFLENHVLQLRLTEPDNESRGLDEEGKDLIHKYNLNFSSVKFSYSGKVSLFELVPNSGDGVLGTSWPPSWLNDFYIRYLQS